MNGKGFFLFPQLTKISIVESDRSEWFPPENAHRTISLLSCWLLYQIIIYQPPLIYSELPQPTISPSMHQVHLLAGVLLVHWDQHPSTYRICPAPNLIPANKIASVCGCCLTKRFHDGSSGNCRWLQHCIITLYNAWKCNSHKNNMFCWIMVNVLCQFFITAKHGAQPSTTPA